ncbi:energy transducer TonB [Sphingomonas faeni]|uniref:energy transducer TonB n=1 Tax=Sphingomonas faeni TaxID=185950 RepID=UPI0020C81BE4|nr:energy transducer TonB [Sphingomonas faeni]MCP8892970.1 energy transducer TonB [Sphingomonas faeni]
MRIKGVALLSAGVLAITAGLTPGGAQTPAATTVQQDFDAAAALDAKPDRAPALAAWERLEARTKPGSRSRGIVLVRKAPTLFALNRSDDSVKAARAGLALLPADDVSLAEDRTRAFLILGQVATDTLDYAGAVTALQQAEASAISTPDKLGAMLALVTPQTFIDPAAAAATLARSDTLIGTMKLDKAVTARFVRARTILKLNTGDIAGARASALQAIRLLGGLESAKIDVMDASARSDAAIAFLLSGNADEARRYMAYTGAGRLTKGSFDPAAEMRSPDCGGDAGLKPQDVAVVEFNIASDGTIDQAMPIYAAGGGQVALEFARAVKGWSWPAEKVQAIPAFYRYHVRVEMRCSTAFERPSIDDGLDGVLEQWLASKGVTVAPEPSGPQAAALAGQRAELASATAQSPNGLHTLAALYRLTSNPTVAREERAALYARGLAIAKANDAPPSARLTFDLPGRLDAVTDIWKPGAYERTLTPMVSEPVYANDPQARAAIRLMMVDGSVARTRKSDKNDTAIVTLRQVVDDKALRPNDPLRVGALIRIASIEERNGQIDAARATFASSGLTANQCAIMDAPPKMVSMPGPEAFPMEAQRWGFEGWTQVQFDIGADGNVINQRALLSYPPFIFSEAGTKFFTKAKYAKTYRPDGGLGCGATTNRIHFMLPS